MFAAIDLSAVTGGMSDLASGVLAVTAAVVVAALALCALSFGSSWLLRLFRDLGGSGAGTASGSGDPRRDYEAYKQFRADGWTPQELSQGGRGPR